MNNSIVKRKAITTVTIVGDDYELIADIEVQEDGSIEVIKQENITVLIDGKEI